MNKAINGKVIELQKENRRQLAGTKWATKRKVLVQNEKIESNEN